MNLTKLVDACLYFMAGSVIAAIVAAFAAEMSSGATAQELEDQYKLVANPIVLPQKEEPAPVILSATESAEVQLEEANNSLSPVADECEDGDCSAAASTPIRTAVSSCVNGVCRVPVQVVSSRPVSTVARSCSRPSRRGIFFRWRRR